MLGGRRVAKPLVALGLVTATVTWVPAPGMTPGVDLNLAATQRWPEPRTLADLYQRRDYFQRLAIATAEVNPNDPDAVEASDPEVTQPLQRVIALEATDRLWALHHRIHHEEVAQRRWQQAVRSAQDARALGPPATLPEDQVVAAYHHWYDAHRALTQVPPLSLAARTAVTQAEDYRQNLAIAAYRYDTLRSGFLADLAAQTGAPERVRITVCNLQRECRRWLGGHPPASPASLIKMPVAVALMDRLNRDGIDYYTPLWINPANWTEDAGAVRVRADYAVVAVMADMVSASGNVATNQLIDYLGWEGVNQPLRDRGYGTTRISSKLVGDRTFPANPGSTANTLTTDELTDMMVGIYNREQPGDELIQTALANQRDVVLGKTALRPPMIWLGEKTGRNSRVLGSTTAVLIGGRPYVITITLDNSANEAAMRNLIAGVAHHILTHNGFDAMFDAMGEAPNPPVPRFHTFLP